MTSQKVCMVILCAAMWQICSASQSNDQHLNNVLARLSYTSTYAAISGQQHSPRICFEIYRNGGYRVSRMTNGTTDTLRGTLTQDELGSVMGLVKGLDFDNRQGGSVIRQGSESFVAETTSGDQTKRYEWLDPDHQRPFPESTLGVINWLQDFKAQGAKRLVVPEFSADPICPRGDGMMPVARYGASCF